MTSPDETLTESLMFRARFDPQAWFWLACLIEIHNLPETKETDG